MPPFLLVWVEVRGGGFGEHTGMQVWGERDPYGFLQQMGFEIKRTVKKTRAVSSLSAWLRWEQSWFGALGLKGFVGITLSGRDGITEDKPSHLSIHPLFPLPGFRAQKLFASAWGSLELHGGFMVGTHSHPCACCR